jgi:hypothetical protein
LVQCNLLQPGCRSAAAQLPLGCRSAAAPLPMRCRCGVVGPGLGVIGGGVPQQKESEQQARQQLFEKHVAEPRRATGADNEDIYGDPSVYDNFSQQMRDGNTGGGAGGGSAHISRSGEKQRQVIREVRSGAWTPDENNQIAEGIRKYYKEIETEHSYRWKMPSHLLPILT